MLVHLLVVAIIVGVLLFLANKVLAIIPMDAGFKSIAWAILVVIAVLALVSVVFPQYVPAWLN